MNSLIAAVNLNSQDVEEGQLPDDEYQQQPVVHHLNNHPIKDSPYSLPSRVKTPRVQDTPHSHSQEASGEIVLEVVEDKFYHDRKSKKIIKGDAKSRTHHSTRDKDKDKDRHHERLEKQKRAQKNEKKVSVSQLHERDDMKSTPPPNNPPYQPPYYPPFMYPPQGHIQNSQFPPNYPPYPYQMPYMQQPPFAQMPMQPYPHAPPPQNQQQLNPYKQQYMPPPPPPQYPDYMMERQHESHFKPPPHHQQQMYRPTPPAYPPYPSYSNNYTPYDYYDRHRQAQQREEKQRAQRRRDFIEELRGELKRNIKEFNGEQSLDILQAAKCIIKFQDYKSSLSTGSQPHKDSVVARCYERSLQRVEKWLQGENGNVREFTKGFFEAMQMAEVIDQARQRSSGKHIEQQHGSFALMASESKK